MKRIFFTFLCLFAGYAAYGQDLIVTASGDSLNCSITEVGTDAIFFRYDAGGNIVSLPKSQVASYKYDFYKSRRGTPAVAVSMRGRSELSFYLGGGLSGLTYKPDDGSVKSGIGGMFGIGYTWFVSGRWGIVTGLELSLYGAEFTTDQDYDGAHRAVSSGTLLGDEFFDFSYKYQTFSEKQTAMFLQIPVMAQFQTGRFFASGGIKIGIPVSGKFNVTATHLETTGRFDEKILYDNLPDYGFGKYEAPAFSGDLDLGIHYAAALEAGGQWMLGKRTNLYVGAWLDYGLGNLNKAGAIGLKKPVVEYDQKETKCLKYNSIVDTTDKLSAMSAGLKVKLTFSL